MCPAHGLAWAWERRPISGTQEGLRGVNDLENTLSRLHRLAIQSRRVTEFRRAFAAETIGK